MRSALYGFASIKVARSAPLLRASIPTAPLPAKRSRNLVPPSPAARMSKRVCLTLPRVGRSSLGAFKALPRALPPMTRTNLFPLYRRRSETSAHNSIISPYLLQQWFPRCQRSRAQSAGAGFPPRWQERGRLQGVCQGIIPEGGIDPCFAKASQGLTISPPR